MSKRVQLRRGTTSEHSAFTGAVGEVTVDTTKDTAVVHDGSTVGGFPLLRESAYTTADVLTKVKTVDGAGSGLDADLLDGQEGSYYATAASVTAAASTQTITDTIMSKAAFNAIAAERRANRAGSGFDEWGSNYTSGNVNDGLYTYSAFVNSFRMGREDTTLGVSKTKYPITCTNGVIHRLADINIANDNTNFILLPTAPTIYPYNATLTTEQIASGVIKHADSSNSGLIVNGKFDTDTSGWTALGAGTTFVSNSGVGELTTTAVGWYAYQQISTVVGKKYIVECSIISGGATAGVYVKQTSNSSTLASKVGVTSGVVSIEFTATEATTRLWLYLNVIGTATFDNIAVYPSDAISRSDLVFLESWHEDVSEKDFVYPLGNVQYLGGATDGLSTPANGAFSGFGTYSLFGNWQTSSALIGKGYVWSALTDAQKKAFVANPENNMYLDGDTYVQVRYRVRVVQGWGDTWANVKSNIADNLVYSTYSTGAVKPKGKLTNIVNDLESYTLNVAGIYRGFSSPITSPNDYGYFSVGGASAVETKAFSYGYSQCFALPIALVHRRNQGGYDATYNANGTKLASDNKKWYETAVSFTNISDCFTDSKLLSASGYIGTTSARADGIFYDQVHEGDILDLRNSSAKVEDYNRLIDREFNKLVAGTYRGSAGEWIIERALQTSTNTTSTAVFLPDASSKLSIGDTVFFYSEYDASIKRVVVSTVGSTSFEFLSAYGSYNRQANSYVVIGRRTTRTKSNTLTHCDIVGNPANYPTAWKQSGVSGTPLIVAEDDTSLVPNGALTVFKLSRKANATPLQVLKSTDSGATWTALSVTTHYTFSTTTNAITMVTVPASTDLIMVTYQTHTNMAVAKANSEVLAIGDAMLTQQKDTSAGVDLGYSLLSKIGVSGAGYEILGKVSNYTIFSTNKLYGGDSTRLPRNLTFTSTLTTTSPTVKTFPYLTRSNGKARLQMVFKEMKYTTSWGDDSKFNIVDNVSTTTDNNAQTVLIGQKYAELPYFISAGE